MSITELILTRCADCRAQFMACPQCVCTIRIDPETGLPPDVRLVDGRTVPTTPDPEAARRSMPHPVCDNCVRTRNSIRDAGGPEAAHMDGPWETWEERHARNHV